MRTAKLLLTAFLVLNAYNPCLLAQFTPIAGWDNQLFPSFIISTATMKSKATDEDRLLLGDRHGLIGVQIVAPSDNAQIEVQIECPEFLETSRFVGKLPSKGETYTVFPKVKYKFSRVSECKQSTPATLSFQVTVDGQKHEASETITFRSIHDCPLIIQSGDDQIDTSFTFAAYVNEQHPFIDKLLREALDIGVVDSFTGYQSRQEAQVIKQVYALWDLMVARDVRYSSITASAADSHLILSQNVRLLEETINNQQANCVDGSVLFASLLRKIDIDASLILVPGHCYVGFYLDAEKTTFLALETTLTGAELDEPEQVDSLLDEAVDEELRGEYSWPSFIAAIETGTDHLLKHKKQFQSQSETDYKMISIAAARQKGVLPIPYTGKEEFMAFDHSEQPGEEGNLEE